MPPLPIVVAQVAGREVRLLPEAILRIDRLPDEVRVRTRAKRTLRLAIADLTPEGVALLTTSNTYVVFSGDRGIGTANITRAVVRDGSVQFVTDDAGEVTLPTVPTVLDVQAYLTPAETPAPVEPRQLQPVTAALTYDEGLDELLVDDPGIEVAGPTVLIPIITTDTTPFAGHTVAFTGGPFDWGTVAAVIEDLGDGPLPYLRVAVTSRGSLVLGLNPITGTLTLTRPDASTQTQPVWLDLTLTHTLRQLVAPQTFRFTYNSTPGSLPGGEPLEIQTAEYVLPTVGTDADLLEYTLTLTNVATEPGFTLTPLVRPDAVVLQLTIDPLFVATVDEPVTLTCDATLQRIGRPASTASVTIDGTVTNSFPDIQPLALNLTYNLGTQQLGGTAPVAQFTTVLDGTQVAVYPITTTEPYTSARYEVSAAPVIATDVYGPGSLLQIVVQEGNLDALAFLGQTATALEVQAALATPGALVPVVVVTVRGITEPVVREDVLEVTETYTSPTRTATVEVTYVTVALATVGAQSPRITAGPAEVDYNEITGEVVALTGAEAQVGALSQFLIPVTVANVPDLTNYVLTIPDAPQSGALSGTAPAIGVAQANIEGLAVAVALNYTTVAAGQAMTQTVTVELRDPLGVLIAQTTLAIRVNVTATLQKVAATQQLSATLNTAPGFWTAGGVTTPSVEGVVATMVTPLTTIGSDTNFAKYAVTQCPIRSIRYNGVLVEDPNAFFGILEIGQLLNLFTGYLPVSAFPALPAVDGSPANALLSATNFNQRGDQPGSAFRAFGIVLPTEATALPSTGTLLVEFETYTQAERSDGSIASTQSQLTLLTITLVSSPPLIGDQTLSATYRTDTGVLTAPGGTIRTIADFPTTGVTSNVAFYPVTVQHPRLPLFPVWTPAGSAFDSAGFGFEIQGTPAAVGTASLAAAFIDPAAISTLTTAAELTAAMASNVGSPYVVLAVSGTPANATVPLVLAGHELVYLADGRPRDLLPLDSFSASLSLLISDGFAGNLWDDEILAPFIAAVYDSRYGVTTDPTTGRVISWDDARVATATAAGAGTISARQVDQRPRSRVSQGIFLDGNQIPNPAVGVGRSGLVFGGALSQAITAADAATMVTIFTPLLAGGTFFNGTIAYGVLDATNVTDTLARRAASLRLLGTASTNQFLGTPYNGTTSALIGTGSAITLPANGNANAYLGYLERVPNGGGQILRQFIERTGRPAIATTLTSAVAPKAFGAIRLGDALPDGTAITAETRASSATVSLMLLLKTTATDVVRQRLAVYALRDYGVTLIP